RGTYRLRLARVGDRSDQGGGREDEVHRHADRPAGDGSQAGEPALAELLPAAALIEIDDQVGLPGDHVGGRIVEGEVPILADTEQQHIDRTGADERTQAAAFGGRIGGIAADAVEGAQVAHGGDEALLEV